MKFIKDKGLLEWEKEAEHPCSRCGNKSHEYCSLYFPFSKIRVYLCDLCYFGLSLGLKFDIEKIMHERIAANHGLTQPK
jgi:hypothetical protein